MGKIVTMKYQVYKILRENINNGIYKPGEQLLELEIAQDLGISRSPVREALKLLVGEGLLVDVPNKGIFVRSFAKKDIFDLYEIRFLYEKYAIDKLRSKWVPSLEEKLLTISTNLQNIDYSKVSFEFDNLTNPHIAIVKSCENDFVIMHHRQVTTLSTMLQSFIFGELQDYKDTVIDHINLIHAILDRDFDNAVSITLAHLIKCQNKALEYVEMIQSL